MNRKILIIDDDQRLNRLLQDYLGKFGVDVDAVIHPAEGLRQIRREPPDLERVTPRVNERGLRDVVLEGDGLHRLLGEPLLHDDDAGGVPAKRGTGERVDLEKRQLHVITSPDMPV